MGVISELNLLLKRSGCSRFSEIDASPFANLIMIKQQLAELTDYVLAYTETQVEALLGHLQKKLGKCQQDP